MALGITVDFNANMVKFAQQLDQMQARMDKFQAKAEGAAIKINSALSGLGVGLSVGGLAAFVKSGIDAADALNDLADRTGIAIENLAGLQYAVKLGDTTIEAFASAANKLSINIAKNADDFAKLGITAKDPVEAFKQLADVFSGIEDPQQRAALGAAALGKAYAEMAPLLMMTGDGIQQLIDKGREHNPVTAEQAQLAGKFNDSLQKLTDRFEHLAIYVAGPAVKALNDFGEAVQFANQVTEGFHPFEWMEAQVISEHGGKLEFLNGKIEEITNSIQKMKSQGAAGEFVDMLFGNNLEELDNKLIKLQVARDKLINGDNANAQPKAAASSKAVQDFIVKTGDAEQATKKLAAAHDGTAKAEAARVESIAAIVDNLKFEIDLTGRSAEQQAILRDIRAATVKATGEEAAAITALIEKKYALIEADEILADGERLAAQQRKELDVEYDRLSKMFSGENQSMFQQFDDAFKARGQDIINDDQLARYLENISQGLDAVTGKAKDSTDRMSAYAEQAARNMQDAFADFLFDPFDKGLDGMLDGFLVTIRQMAANAASQNIMEGLFGKGGGFSGGLLGGLFNGGGGGKFNGTGPLMSFQNSMSWGDVGKWFSGIGSSIGGLFKFADGGIMTSSGPLPLHAYATGGIANTPQLALFGEGRLPEAFVPLPDGRRIPVKMDGGGKSVVNHVNVYINTPNADSFRRSERQIRDQIARAMNT